MGATENRIERRTGTAWQRGRDVDWLPLAVAFDEAIARRAWEIHTRRERPLSQWQGEWPGDWQQAVREVQESAGSANPSERAEPDALPDRDADGTPANSRVTVL